VQTYVEKKIKYNGRISKFKNEGHFYKAIGPGKNYNIPD
jgi:hypothetical protein